MIRCVFVYMNYINNTNKNINFAFEKGQISMCLEVSAVVFHVKFSSFRWDGIHRQQYMPMKPASFATRPWDGNDLE